VQQVDSDAVWVGQGGAAVRCRFCRCDTATGEGLQRLVDVGDAQCDVGETGGCGRGRLQAQHVVVEGVERSPCLVIVRRGIRERGHAHRFGEERLSVIEIVYPVAVAVEVGHEACAGVGCAEFRFALQEFDPGAVRAFDEGDAAVCAPR
jgi:hypothetical protein